MKTVASACRLVVYTPRIRRTMKKIYDIMNEMYGCTYDGLFCAIEPAIVDPPHSHRPYQQFDEVNIKNALEQGAKSPLVSLQFTPHVHFSLRFVPFDSMRRVQMLCLICSRLFVVQAFAVALTYYLLPILIEQTNACTMYPRRFIVRTPTLSSRWFSNCLK